MLKVVVSVATFYFIFRSISWVDVRQTLLGIEYSVVILALLIFWSAQLVSAIRCAYVARVLGGKLSFLRSTRAHFIGLWFNQVLPTSLGGDVVKVAILQKPLGIGVAVRTAILDRLSGFLFLLLAVALTLPLYAKVFSGHPDLVALVAVLSLGGLLATFLAAYVGKRITFQFSHRPRLVKLLAVFSDIWKFKRRSYLMEQLWTSAIVHFNGIVTYGLLGVALGLNISWLAFVLIVPIIFLIALIPVSFAGWGLREVGAVWLFGVVGVSSESAIAISISFGLLLIVAGLPGLLMVFANREAWPRESNNRKESIGR